MTTKIQPANIDQSLDYTVDQLTANTVVAGGVDLYAFANSAFTTANAAGSSAMVVAAYDQANSAYDLANAAPSLANTFVLTGFPIGDYGSVTDPNIGGLGEEQLATIWDNRTTVPTHLIFSNNTIILDAGYVS